MLHGSDARTELDATYRRLKAERGGLRTGKKSHPRLPYFLWVRRRGPDMDNTMLRMSLTIAALTLFVGVHAPWWAYPALLALTAATWPFRLRVPRTLILWNPTPQQRETWQHTADTEAEIRDQT